MRKLKKQGFILYEEGTEFVDTFEDEPDKLKPLDDKILNRIENIRDLVLYRFGSTGVVQVLQAATDILGLIPVYTVKNIQTFTGGNGTNVFRDCFWSSEEPLLAKLPGISWVARSPLQALKPLAA